MLVVFFGKFKVNFFIIFFSYVTFFYKLVLLLKSETYLSFTFFYSKKNVKKNLISLHVLCVFILKTYFKQFFSLFLWILHRVEVEVSRENKKKSCFDVWLHFISCFQAIMNLVLLLSIILAVQLPLFTFGKSSQAKVESATTSKISLTTTPNDNDDRDASTTSTRSDKSTATRMRRNSINRDDDEDDNKYDDFSINKLSREFPISILANACNEWVHAYKHKFRCHQTK